MCCHLLQTIKQWLGELCGKNNDEEVPYVYSLIIDEKENYLDDIYIQK